MKIFFAVFLLGAQALFAFDNLNLGAPSDADAVINREGYAVGYSALHRQPLWVTYKLTRAELEATPVARRRFDFTLDPLLSVDSARPKDYRHSGYDRGHMAPAADMSFSEKVMRESFYFSNVCPQKQSFNRGIWVTLEEKMREWARAEEELYIVTGPVFSSEASVTIGPNGVTVPAAFYKVALTLSETPKAIAFLLPHRTSNDDLQTFILTVDALEELTGLDFFPDLPDGLEAEVESMSVYAAWSRENGKGRR